jgi:hypothetical protein
MTQKNCNCSSKYCPHYESDFDRYVKENPVVGTQETWRKRFDKESEENPLAWHIDTRDKWAKDFISKVEQQAITRTRLEVREIIGKHNAEILNEFQLQIKPEMPMICYDERIALIPAMEIATKKTLALPSLQITDEKK